MKSRIRVRKQALIEVLVGATLLSPLMGDAPAGKAATAPLLGSTASRAAAVATAPINPDDWQTFAGALRQRAKRFDGTVGYIVKDLRTGEVVESNQTGVFPSASLIKLPIMVVAFQAVQEGRLSLAMPITLRRQDRRGGSGVLKFASPGTVFTLRELLEYMIIHSDNTATELIVQQLGFEYIQSTFQHLGLKDTEIHPDGFRLAARHVAEDNRTSPRDMAFCLEKIYQRKMVSAGASDQMLDILKHQKLRDRLPRFIPTGWEIAHKTGLLRRACHDVGIVFSPGGDYLICVLTSHDATYKTAKRFIASLGRITFDYYQSGFHRPMLQSRRDVAFTQPAS
jgi:beta-lactamase class A